MKFWIITFLIVSAGTILSCEGEQQQNVDWVSVDDGIIQDYLTEHNITATKHSSGLYYRITTEGNGQHPNSTSTVKLNYKGYLTDGTVFDQQNGAEISLTRVIQGWQIGVPLISKGGGGQLFIPSFLGYGNSSYADIPRNSVLIFDVELINF